MKFTLAAMALFASSTFAMVLTEDMKAKGYYIRSAADVELEGLPIVDLEITDERFPGKTFYGTVESVYAQMREINPDAVGNATAEAVSKSLLAKRQGSINCGWGGGQVPQWSFCIDGLTYLMNLGTSWCGVNAAPSCARVSCSHGCGIFLCNKLGHHLQVHCGDIPRDVNAIGNACADSFSRFKGARDFSSHFIGVQDQRC